MREILFRGKTKSGDWVYGDLLNVGVDYDYAIRTYGGREHGQVNSVNEKTIGQYTGLTDKNGTKIFEGDIVKITDTIVDFETTAYIEFGNPNGLYNWGWQLVPLQKKPFAVEILHWCDMEETGAFIEVIGNIHDNPELLKGGV